MEESRRLIPAQWRAVAEAFAIGPLVFAWTVTIAMWPDLPERVPTHFGLDGRPDAWGGKGISWLMPIVHLGTWLLITLVQRFPDSWNYPVKITEENRAVQQQNAMWMLLILKFIVGVTFAWVQWGALQSAVGRAAGLHPALVASVVTAVALSIAFFLMRAFRLR
jgi:uncharacterized membrane protein